MPWTQANCPMCKITIGGSGHKAAEGQTRVREYGLDDENAPAATGYMLAATDNDDINRQFNVRRDTVRLIRLILHSLLSVSLALPQSAADVSHLILGTLSISFPLFFPSFRSDNGSRA